MGPGRTGVKGVIRDRNEATSLARTKRAAEVDALNRAMEKASLGGLTWAEEERLRQAEKAREEGRPTGPSSRAPFSKGRFGHLREVGERGYVQAIESEDRNVWVVVHIYDPVSVPRIRAAAVNLIPPISSRWTAVLLWMTRSVVSRVHIRPRSSCAPEQERWASLPPSQSLNQGCSPVRRSPCAGRRHVTFSYPAGTPVQISMTRTRTRIVRTRKATAAGKMTR